MVGIVPIEHADEEGFETRPQLVCGNVGVIVSLNGARFIRLGCSNVLCAS